MVIYDLMWGNFDIAKLKDDMVPYLIGYYPFYLYRSGFFIIPDTLNTSLPFMKEQTYLTSVFLNIQQTTCYLLNQKCQGYIMKQKNPKNDSPFDSRTFSLSFDLVTPFKPKIQYLQDIKLFEVEIRSNSDKFLNKFSINAQINFDVVQNNLGDFAIEVFDGNSNTKSFKMEVEANSTQVDSMKYRPQYTKNSFEKIRNLRILLSKQTFFECTLKYYCLRMRS